MGWSECDETRLLGEGFCGRAGHREVQLGGGGAAKGCV